MTPKMKKCCQDHDDAFAAFQNGNSFKGMSGDTLQKFVDKKRSEIDAMQNKGINSVKMSAGASKARVGSMDPHGRRR